MSYKTGDSVHIELTTNEFNGTIVRPLNEGEVDPEVGPMYVVAIHVYDDELTPTEVRVPS